jgi:hypothetical protein
MAAAVRPSFSDSALTLDLPLSVKHLLVNLLLLMMMMMLLVMLMLLLLLLLIPPRQLPAVLLCVALSTFMWQVVSRLILCANIWL